ncbi:pentapeptide repeat-containing protein [Corynebacterium sphenisci]|uniref:pentapeptide repeat-containing protein n=1 Tax=Corynebacterium sphenisci TaxID=191493 RepID=UPI001B80098E|nr:pentapeptide repeat-containing protein [Corynebacterium sphenisci]
MTTMTADQIKAAVARAREEGERPDLRGIQAHGANLRGADLYRADLRGADLYRADLYRADLRRADLRGVNLHGATLSSAALGDADLIGADLSKAALGGADLHGADLWNVDFHSAYLRGTDLRDVDLTGADLTLATLTGANFHDVLGLPVLSINGLPSGHLVLCPTPGGWRLSIGCWTGTPDELRELIAGDDWPSGCAAAERARRRPLLTAATIELAESFIAAHPGPHFPPATD